MTRVYYVQNRKNSKVLNQKGEWSERLTSYRLAEFDTEAAAQAAFPAGVDCVVVSRTKKESDQ